MEIKERNELNTLTDNIHDPWWEEPILLFVGISKDATPFIREIKRLETEDKRFREDIFHSNLMLLGKCIADAPFTESDLRKEIIDRLWQLYQTAEFTPLKEKAIKILALIKPDDIIDSLIEDLKEKDSSVRESAADALGMMGSEKAIEPLIKALTTDKDRSVRESAADALGMMGSEKAIEPLKNALKDEGEGEGEKVKDKAFESLEKISRRIEKRITIEHT